MISLSKSRDFFDPSTVRERIHIIGCGAIGSTLAEMLVRVGFTKLSLYDFDVVEAHNVANQMFGKVDIGKKKTEALVRILSNIDPDIVRDLRIFENGYIDQRLSGYVFLCVDNIELRREICEKIKNNPFVKGVFDFRMRLTDAQHYAANWKVPEDRESLLNSMDFSHEEAANETPMSACNMTLSFCPTVRIVVAHGVSNFVGFLKGESLKRIIVIDAYSHEIMAV